MESRSLGWARPLGMTRLSQSHGHQETRAARKGVDDWSLVLGLPETQKV